MQINFYHTPPNNWDRQINQYANDGGILQSSMWANFQKTLGRTPHYITIKKDDKIQLLAIVIENKIKLKPYISFFIPRGPILTQPQNSKEILSFFFSQLKQWGKTQKSTWLIIEPPHEEKILQLPNFFKKIYSIEPQHTLIIDISPSEKEILQQTHSKTRYNIRLAEKKGVKITNTTTPTETEFKSFYNLLSKTKTRQNFGIYNKDYFEKLFTSLKKTKKLYLFLAKYEDKTIASAVIVHYNNRAYYLYGGSDYSYRKLMAPHLLHWEVIKHAKQQGLKNYDMWGIQNPNDTKGKEKTWGGLTRFKQGFSPQTQTTSFMGTYQQTYHPVITKLYNTAIVLKKLLKK